MPTLLKIDVSPRGDHSISRHLGQTFAAEWQKTHSGTIVTRDLATTALPFVDGDWIAAVYTPPEHLTAEQKEKIKLSDELLDELFAADHLLITAPMYNFSIPAALKAWIDQIVRLDKTFNASYQGLVLGKKATVLIASGGNYGPGSGREAYDAESPYLKAILGFIGITDVNIVYVGDTSGVMMGKVSMQDFLTPLQPTILEAAK